MASHQGNVSHAARAAGKERRSFQRLLRKYQIDSDVYRPERDVQVARQLDGRRADLQVTCLNGKPTVR
jgi:hypothetical protein